MGRVRLSGMMFLVRAKNRRGLTLLELMIAAGVLLIALSGLLGAFVGCIVLNESAKDTTVAVNDARRVLEEVRRTSETSLAAVVATNWTNWAANNGCDTLDNENVNVAYLDPGADPLQITVTVNWTTRRRPLNVQFTTLMTRR